MFEAFGSAAATMLLWPIILIGAFGLIVRDSSILLWIIGLPIAAFLLVVLRHILVGTPHEMNSLEDFDRRADRYVRSQILNMGERRAPSRCRPASPKLGPGRSLAVPVLLYNA